MSHVAVPLQAAPAVLCSDLHSAARPGSVTWSLTQPPRDKKAAVPLLWAWFCADQWENGQGNGWWCAWKIVLLWRWGDVTWHKGGRDPAQVCQPCSGSCGIFGVLIKDLGC